MLENDILQSICYLAYLLGELSAEQENQDRGILTTVVERLGSRVSEVVWVGNLIKACNLTTSAQPGSQHSSCQFLLQDNLISGRFALHLTKYKLI